MDNGGDPLTKMQTEIVTSVRPRRRWSRAEKERIVAAAMEPGAVASAVAREAGIQVSQLFRWRRQLHGAARFASLTLEIPTDAATRTKLPLSPGVIEVEFKTGARLRICGPVDAPIGGHAGSDRLWETVTIFRGFKHRPLPIGSICQRKDNGDDRCCCLTVGTALPLTAVTAAEAESGHADSARNGQQVTATNNNMKRNGYLCYS